MTCFQETCPFYLPRSSPTIGATALCAEVDDEGLRPLLPVNSTAVYWHKRRKIESGRVNTNELTGQIPM